MEMKRYPMKYKIDKRRKNNNILNILGKNFVKNNINKGKLIIENKKYYLKEYIELNNFKKTELKIDILLNNDISHLNCMFRNCESLFKFSSNDYMERKKNYYDISKTEKNDNELTNNINEINKDKVNIYENLKDDSINSEYSEILKRDESLEPESMYWEIYNLI